MPILPSAAKRIQDLLGRLESAAAAERDSAVAQLTLLGPRTLSHVPGFLARATPGGRLAILDVVERLGGKAGLPLVLGLVEDRHEEVARRAIEVAAAFPDPKAVQALSAVLSSGTPALHRAAAAGLSRLHGLGLVEAVDPLLRVVLAEDEDESLRLVALEVLSAIDRRTLRPALRRLAGDKSPALARAAAELQARLARPAAPASTDASTPGATLATWLSRLTASRTPSADLPKVLAAIVAQRSPALVPLLRQRLDELGRDAEETGAEAVARAKARVHLALGALDSRIALHDLRDLLKARPLCAVHDLLTAARQVGDASLVPALAAVAADHPALAEPAGTALKEIARREGLRRTSRVIRTLRPGHRAAVEPLLARQRATSPGASRARNRKLR
jgi:HEAT repeat protein